MSEIERSDVGQGEAMTEPGELALDPFGFLHNIASCIAGLGGNAPGHDPSYAFHTRYVPVARGHARFTVRFHDLRARRGTLVLRVHMLPDEPGSTARLVNSTRIQLNRVVQNGGEIEIGFEGYRGFTFAVMGQVPDETDAYAAGLTVILDRPADGAETDAGPLEDIRTTRFGSSAVRPTGQLLTMRAPSLATPVSQPCTAEQMREPVWRALCRELGRDPIADPASWPAVFTLQALRFYGMVEAGARGLLLAHDDSLATALRASGGEVVLLPPDAETSADAIGETPFDYLCSAAALGEPAAVPDMIAEVQRLLAHVRPGGLAVHLLPLDGGPVTPGFRRSDLERIALLLIADRHEIAQVAPGGTIVTASGGTPAFGLVFRRARSPL